MGGSSNKSQSQNTYSGTNESDISGSSSFGQEIPEYQQNAQQNLYNQAGQWYQDYKSPVNENHDVWWNTPELGQQAQYMDALGNTEGMNDVARQQWEEQVKGGEYANHDLAGGIGQSYQNNNLVNMYGGQQNADRLTESLDNSLNTPSNAQAIQASVMGGSGNNYADAMKNQYIDDANRAQQMMTGNMDARAAASGMSGGSRHGTAIGLGNYDINKNLQRNLAETGYNTFDKDLNRKLKIAEDADSNTLSRQGMLQQMIGSQQGAENRRMDIALGREGQLHTMLNEQEALTGQGLANQGTMDAANRYRTEMGRDYLRDSNAGAETGNQMLQGLNSIYGDPTILTGGSSSNTESSSGTGAGAGFSASKGRGGGIK